MKEKTLGMQVMELQSDIELQKDANRVLRAENEHLKERLQKEASWHVQNVATITQQEELISNLINALKLLNTSKSVG